jgi:hypothetical protein
VNLPTGEEQGSTKPHVSYAKMNGDARREFRESLRLDWRWFDDSRKVGIHPINKTVIAKLRASQWSAGKPRTIVVEVFHKETGILDRMVWDGSSGWTEELRNQVESFVEIYRSR